MKSIVAIMFIILAAFVSGCRNLENQTSDSTATISPATPRVDESSTDAVTTETIDVGDSERSPAEGAGASAEPTETTGTTTTGTTRRP